MIWQVSEDEVVFKLLAHVLRVISRGVVSISPGLFHDL